MREGQWVESICMNSEQASQQYQFTGRHCISDLQVGNEPPSFLGQFGPVMPPVPNSPPSKWIHQLAIDNTEH